MSPLANTPVPLVYAESLADVLAEKWAGIDDDDTPTTR